MADACTGLRPAAAEQRGAALALAVLWLPSLVALGLITAAAGHLLALRQQLHDSAEAAALAAVRQLDGAARARGELRLDPTAAAEAARAVAAANLVRLPGGALVAVEVRQAEPPPTIGPQSRGGRSVAGQAEPPSVGVSLKLTVTLPGLGQRVVLSTTAWAGLRPPARDP